MSLVVSHASQQHLNALTKQLPHASLLAGPVGIGLDTIAQHISLSYGEVITIRPVLLTKTSTTKAIGVDRIRELYEQVRTKHRSHRIVIIDDADAMNVSAQNALLKLLEEPNESTSFILTSHAPDSLLPTVRSRTQTYVFSPVSREQTEQLLETLPKLTPQKKAQLLFIAEGLPAEMIRLAKDDAGFRARVRLVQQAKSLLESNSYMRIAHILSEKLARQNSIELIDALIMLLTRKPTPEGTFLLDKLIDTRTAIMTGGNIKLQLTAAMI